MPAGAVELALPGHRRRPLQGGRAQPHEVRKTTGVCNVYDWQSSGVRGVSFLSDAYLAAIAFTIGLMT